jgi:outer membrane lipoprotein-sorting protein
MRGRLAAVGLGLLLGAPAELRAETAVDRFAALLGAMQDAEARFEQTRYSTLLPEPMAASGRLWLKRPGQLKLAYRDPEPMTLLKRADTTWIYVPSLEQVQRYRVEAVGVPLGIALGASRETLERETVLEADGDWVRLEPRGERPAAWTEIEIELPPGSSFPKRLVVHQTGGDRLEFEFLEVRRNRGLRSRTFLPDWPDTTPVISVGL